MEKDCPSGLLNRSTFLSMYTQFFPDGKARLFYEHLFRTFDQDNSGQIDFNEFLTFPIRQFIPVMFITLIKSRTFFFRSI
ncbi:unnamed protein product [Protopolystoma xenopodis]|uniref:EF-hand domain-containing protein n=1 Tax=Protopolystoma xenopodis TaxID=117903 RepID=A0A3S5AXT7_9PLAT|nr:unnamed protein product [Protopolystoma xenopodis]